MPVRVTKMASSARLSECRRVTSSPAADQETAPPPRRTSTAPTLPLSQDDTASYTFNEICVSSDTNSYEDEETGINIHDRKALGVTLGMLEENNRLLMYNNNMVNGHSSHRSVGSRASQSLQFLKKSIVGTPSTFLRTADERREKRRQMTYEPTHHWWEPPLHSWIPETNREILVVLFLYNTLVVLLAHYTPLCGVPDPSVNANRDPHNHVMCGDEWILLEDKALVGFAVGMFLLLAFRANQAYDRWWEGRKMWGRTREVCRDYARLVCSHVVCDTHADRMDRRRAIDFLTAFGVALKLHLRGEKHIVKDLTEKGTNIGQRMHLNFQDIANIQQASHMPLFCLDVLSDYLAKQQRANKLSDYQMGVINTTVMAVLSDALGSCERIRNTPIPLSYVLQLRFFLILWLVLYPLHVMAFYGWYTILLASLISYAVLGIESMASEIENPFGYDRNDLDLDCYCQGICSETQDIVLRHESVVASSLFDRETIVELNQSQLCDFHSGAFVDTADKDMTDRATSPTRGEGDSTTTTGGAPSIRRKLSTGKLFDALSGNSGGGGESPRNNKNRRSSSSRNLNGNNRKSGSSRNLNGHRSGSSRQVVVGNVSATSTTTAQEFGC